MYKNDEYADFVERTIKHTESELLNSVDQMIESLKLAIVALEASKKYDPAFMDMKVDEVVDNVSWRAKQFGQHYNYYSEFCIRLDAIKEYNGTKEG